MRTLSCSTMVVALFALTTAPAGAQDTSCISAWAQAIAADYTKLCDPNEPGDLARFTVTWEMGTSTHCKGDAGFYKYWPTTPFEVSAVGQCGTEGGEPKGGEPMCPPDLVGMAPVKVGYKAPYGYGFRFVWHDSLYNADDNSCYDFNKRQVTEYAAAEPCQGQYCCGRESDCAAKGGEVGPWVWDAATCTCSPACPTCPPCGSTVCPLDRPQCCMGMVCAPSDASCCPGPEPGSGLTRVWCDAQNPICCGEGCCLATELCCGNGCIAGGQCCDSGNACPPGSACCNSKNPGKCCKPGETCCTPDEGGGCCERGTTCDWLELDDNFFAPVCRSGPSVQEGWSPRLEAGSESAPSPPRGGGRPGGGGGGESGGGGGAGSTCEQMGWSAAEAKTECDAACNKPDGCVKKQWCGAGPCQPWPNYCWKCPNPSDPPDEPPPLPAPLTCADFGLYNSELDCAGGGWDICSPVGKDDGVGGTVNCWSGSRALAPIARAGGPYSGLLGQPMVLDASGSSDPNGDIASHHWSFGDGTSGSGARVSHTFPPGSSFAVTLTVVDRRGAAGVATTTVTFLPSTPVSWTDLVNTVADGDTLRRDAGENWFAGGISKQTLLSGDGFVEFTAAETNTYRMAGLSHGNETEYYSDIDYAIYLHAGGVVFVFENGAALGDFGTYAAGDRFKVSVENGVVRYWKNGLAFYTSTVPPTYPLLMDVSIGSIGGTITDAVIAGTFPPNQPPRANPGGPYFAGGQRVARVDGRASDDPDGDIVSYEWDFGDGATASGVSAVHTYDALGTYTVRLTVRDSQGLENSATTTVTVPPVEEVVWTNVVNSSASGNNLTNVSGENWNAGAVSDRKLLAGPGFVAFNALNTDRHVMAGLGHQDASQYYTDLDYAIYLVAGGAVQIYESGVYRGTFGTYLPSDRFHLWVDATGVVRYLRNGQTFYTSAVVARNYPLHLDTSLATPGAGITRAVIAGIFVNQPPAANAGGPYNAVVGQPVVFDGRGSSDPDDGALAYDWDFGDGTNGTGATPSHTYTAAGTPTVTLRVTDAPGATAIATVTVTVSPRYASAFNAGPWGACAGTGPFTCTSTATDGCRRPGTQTRSVTETAWTLDPALAATPPPAAQACTQTIRGYVTSYYLGPWSPCNAPCGTGFTFRTVSPNAWGPVGPDVPAPIDNSTCNTQACALTCWDYEMYDTRSDCQGAGWSVCEMRHPDDAVGGVLSCWKGF